MLLEFLGILNCKLQIQNGYCLFTLSLAGGIILWQACFQTLSLCRSIYLALGRDCTMHKGFTSDFQEANQFDRLCSSSIDEIFVHKESNCLLLFCFLLFLLSCC